MYNRTEEPCLLLYLLIVYICFIWLSCGEISVLWSSVLLCPQIFGLPLHLKILNRSLMKHKRFSIYSGHWFLHFHFFLWLFEMQNYWQGTSTYFLLNPKFPWGIFCWRLYLILSFRYTANRGGHKKVPVVSFVHETNLDLHWSDKFVYSKRMEYNGYSSVPKLHRLAKKAFLQFRKS